MTALDLGEPDAVPIFELYINESSLVRLADALGIGRTTLWRRMKEFGLL